MLVNCKASTFFYSLLLFYIASTTTTITLSVQVQAFVTSTDSSHIYQLYSAIPESAENVEHAPSESIDVGSSDGGKEQDSVLNDRWKNAKERIIKKYVQLDYENKRKKEGSVVKKRRMMDFYKELQEVNKHASKISRPMSLYSGKRILLSSLHAGQGPVNGTVISLTNFGAYIDIGTECDGLLHVGQITREFFVEHPRQVLHPGESVNVWIARSSPELKKLQLTMLSPDVKDPNDEDDEDERIPLSELETNDELWGKIKRITSYGAYVELGTEADGWLHFMDHPKFKFGKLPNEFMKLGDRIRCWVVNVDTDRERLKLTANRPQDLPGPDPRRELRLKSP